jgi:arginine/lysine/ornithine decarboxylase
MRDLLHQLKKYGKSKMYPFHMPGHKRHMKKKDLKNPYKVDITEIEGFDDLHHATGVLKKSQQRAARMYASEHTFFSVNGSTAGILSAISTATSRKGTILLARNSHKAAFHAVLLRQLKVKYVYPSFISKFDLNGGISPEEVRKKLEESPETEAVFITSPTAEGIVSDVKEIAKVCHAYGKVLIVDEAHGAHFGFDEDFPKSSVSKGADVVITSVHKTLPAFTQTALIHVNGSLIDLKRMEEFLAIYQTSSPSYILMGGIDRCMELLERKQEKLFRKFKKRLAYFHKKTAELQLIEILGEKDIQDANVLALDPGKLVISLQKTSYSGEWLQEELRKKYKLQMEMASPTYVLAIATIMDRKKGFKRLQKALRKIDKQLVTEFVKNENKDHLKVESKMHLFHNIEEVFASYQAKEAEKENISFLSADGRVSAEFVILYPPGIPLIVPGERMRQEQIDAINDFKEQGLSVQGMHDKSAEWIEVVVE